MEPSKSTSIKNNREGSSHGNLTDLENSKECTIPKMKNISKQEEIVPREHEAKSSNSNSLTWPSLWQKGPRRSAFQPYKPSREVAVPRPASTTVMTNLQRGNMQAEAAPAAGEMSWFTLAGRGDITAELLEEMIAQGKDLNTTDEEGLTALMWASYHGQIHTVGTLLQAGGGGLEVDWAGMWGETALMLAATNGHLEIVRILIAAGADVNQQDHSGETALMCAAHGDHPHTVSELLSCGADMSIKNSNNCTAYDIAIDQHARRSKSVLEKYMLSLLTVS